MRRLLAPIAAVSVVLSLGLATGALADDAKSVQVVGQEGRAVEFLVYLDPSIQATPETAVASRVVVASTEVPSEAKVVLEDPTPREAILVLDVSGSMKGQRVQEARAAAVEYTQALPKDVNVGLVSFNDKVVVGVAPTGDRKAVVAGLEGMRAARKTALFDGIIAGLDAADPDRQSRIVLLSDGGDTASAATLDDVVARVAGSDVPIDVVALTPNVEHADILRGIAAESGGQFLLATDAGQLRAAFEEASGSFGGRVAVTATMPPEVDASGNFAIVTVAIDGTDYTGTAKMPSSPDLEGDGTATVTVPTPVPTTAPTTGAAESSSTATYPVLLAVLAGLVVAMLALTVAVVQRRRKALLRTEQVLWYSNAITGDGVRSVAPTRLEQQGLVKAIDRQMQKTTGYGPTEIRLDNAELPFTPGSWLVVRVVLGALLVAVLGLLFGTFWVGLIVGVPLAWLGGRTYLGMRENKTRKKFEEELPDFLMLVASSLRSGLSFTQALDSTAAEGKGQVSRQMRRVMRETQMGLPLEESLMRASERMQSEDLKWTVTALAIQREVGGNLSNILETAAQTIQDRAALRREVRTLSAEGRLSGWILAGLPVGIFLWFLIANRAYVSFFWTETIGKIMVAVMTVIFIAGFLWMRKLVKIKV